MAKRLFSSANWTPTAVADATSFTAATYAAIQGGSTTQLISILEVLIEGETSASAISYLQLAYDSTVGATTTALSAPNSDGPMNPATAALAAPPLSFIAATTEPQRSNATTSPRLRMTINCYGGIIKWNPYTPDMVLQILGNSTVHGELSLSAYTGSSGSGQVSSNIIYEPF
jgi:hypothetical protein